MKRRTILTLLVVVLATALMARPKPKYIFYMIGDGMGLNQVAATEMYLAECDGYIGRKPLCMTGFPVTGLITTFSESNGITDSSAAGTALAAGVKTTNGTLGLTGKGEHYKTIAEQLHQNGWNIGIMTSVSIDHATPGAFYAHVTERSDYYTVGTQLPESEFEFFAGATFYKPYLENKPEAPNVYDLCNKAGYKFYHGYEDFIQNGVGADRAILIQKHEGLENTYLGKGNLPYAIDRNGDELTLEQITDAAIVFLQKKNKPFFMMVEGGQIDWASHSNDAATVIQETIDFDKAIRRAYKFYSEHPEETLIVVTADHETGGMALGNHKYTLNLQLLQNQKASVAAISDRLKKMKEERGKKLTYDEVKALFQETLGLYDVVEVSKDDDAKLRATFKQMMKNKAHDTKTLYASLNALAAKAVQLLDRKAHIGWTTGAHSGAPVPVYAVGAGAENFTGVYDNTEVMKRMLKLAEED